MTECKCCGIERKVRRGEGKHLCPSCENFSAFCPKCEHVKPRDEFSVARGRRNGLYAYCNSCRVQLRVKYTYNLSSEQYSDLYELQSGLCAICNQPPNGTRLCVDHCHDSGEVRGLLCEDCNRAIGLLKDSIDNITNAAKYLAAAG